MKHTHEVCGTLHLANSFHRHVSATFYAPSFASKLFLQRTLFDEHAYKYRFSVLNTLNKNIGPTNYADAREIWTAFSFIRSRVQLVYHSLFVLSFTLPFAHLVLLSSLHELSLIRT